MAPARSKARWERGYLKGAKETKRRQQGNRIRQTHWIAFDDAMQSFNGIRHHEDRRPD